MTQKKKRIPLVLLTLFALLITGATGIEQKSSASAVQNSAPLVEEAVAGTQETIKKPEQELEATPPPAPWLNYPNACETFTVIEGTKLVKRKHGGKDYPMRYRRNRYKRKKSDQQRTRELVKMVVKEMGGDEDAQRIVSMIAMHESSWNSEAIHILNPDLDANQAAWQRHSYSANTERTIELRMEAASKKSNKDGYYGLKARLADIQLYKGNPHWDAKLRYDHVIPERTYRGETYPTDTYSESRSVWAFGYGLYGMNAVLFTHLWDREAPPWILCGDEGIMATVVAVWSLRKAQSTCEYLSKDNPEKYGTDGGSAYGVVRRFARGKCSDKRLGPAWRRLMAGLKDIDWGSSPSFGTGFTRYEMYRKNKKWRFRYEMEIDPETGEPKKNSKGKPIYKRNAQGRRIKIRTDRQDLLAHMRAKAEEKGLLRPALLERKKGGAPVVIANNRVETAAVGAL